MGDYGQSSPPGGPGEPSGTLGVSGLLGSPVLPSLSCWFSEALTFGFPLQKCLHFLQPAQSASSWYDGDILQ